MFKRAAHCSATILVFVLFAALLLACGARGDAKTANGTILPNHAMPVQSSDSYAQEFNQAWCRGSPESIFGPLDSSEQLVKEDKVSVPVNGAEAGLSLRDSGFVTVDFAVEPEKQLTLMILTEDQYNQAASGQTPSGQPLLRETASGKASAQRRLSGGTYYVLFLNDTGAPVKLIYRVEYQRSN